MEGALEGDEAVALGIAARRVIFPRHLDRAFQRFRTGIGEEHDIREGEFRQALREPLAFRNPVDIRDMPELAGLLGERVHEMRMRMARDIHRDARRKIQEASTIGRSQPRPVPSLEGEFRARIGRQQCRLRVRFGLGDAALGVFRGSVHGDPDRRSSLLELQGKAFAEKRTPPGKGGFPLRLCQRFPLKSQDSPPYRHAIGRGRLHHPE